MERSMNSGLTRIGVFTGKFKPPHVGHYKSILEIAEQNDETHVFVSPREEGGITGEMATEILNLYFEDRQDVQIHLAEVTPVRAAYEFVEELGQSESGSGCQINLYALPEDMKRFGSMQKWLGNIPSLNQIETSRPEFVKSAEEAGDSDGVSGTLMRSFLRDGDKENFFLGLPAGVDKDKVWDIVTDTPVDEEGTYAIPADSFNQQIDPNIMPTDINTQVGGLPSHWVTTQPYSRFDLKTNPIADRFGLNPKSRPVKTFDEFCKEPNK